MSDYYDSDELYVEDPCDSDEEDLSDDDAEQYVDGDEVTKKIKPINFTVISTETLGRLQHEALERVQSILGCTTATARTLLIHYQWDTEKLFGVMAERGENAVFKAAGVTNETRAEAARPASGTVTCSTCFCDIPVAETTTMECEHTFCNECWKGYFRVSILEGKSRRLKCMGVKCGVICDETKVKSLLVDDPLLLKKYETSLLESYIDDNKRVKWCPSVPHCGHAIQVDGEPYCEPQCACGWKFCFNCLEEPHSPCTCEMWKRWKQKSQDDSETKNWLTANTKPCPKCSKPVEKNGGCNLVVCNCGQAFCWLCGAATGRDHTWTSISGHSCGRWKEENDKKVDEAQRNIKRYLHYYSRWTAHLQSQKKEHDQKGTMQDKIAVLEDTSTTLKDYSWLWQALQQLFDARHILGYSYAFAFYMFGNEMFKEEINVEQNRINQNLFEDQQQQLEGEVERLSHLIQSDTASMNDSMRQDIINSAKNIEKRIFNLYKLIENDLLGQLLYSLNYIAPYKGESTLQLSGTRVSEAGSSAAEGTSHFGLYEGARGSPTEVIDLTNDSQYEGKAGRSSSGKRHELANMVAHNMKRKK